MVIRRKYSVNKQYYELSGQMSFFGKDNLYYKTVTLVKEQRYVNLCNKFILKKIFIKKRVFLPLLEIY